MKKQLSKLTQAIVAFMIIIAIVVVNGTNLNYVSADKSVNQTIEELTHEDIVDVTNRFTELLIQDIDESYRVIDFNTKEELLNAFTEVTTKELAIDYVDYYFIEREEALYILPTEAPPAFIPGNDYNMIQLSETEFVIQQTNFSYIYGEYTLEINFTFEADWKITGMQVK